MKIQFLTMEDEPLKRSRRLQNLPPAAIVEPPPPPQRRILDIDGSFEPVGVSEVLGEPKIRKNQVDRTVVEIEYLQADDFERNFNSLLTDWNDLMIVQVLSFSSPSFGVSLSQVMSILGEGIFTPTSTILVGGVPPPPVGAPRPSASTAPFSPSSRVVQPSTPSNVVDISSGVVTGISNAPFASHSFMQTVERGPSGSSSFVQGFPWNGGHIPPSTPYVGPTPTYVGM